MIWHVGPSSPFPLNNLNIQTSFDNNNNNSHISS